MEGNIYVREEVYIRKNRGERAVMREEAL